MSDWYSVPRIELKKRGRGLLSHYKTMGELLQAVYPDYPWDASKFSSHGYWEDDDNCLKALANAERKLGIENVSETNKEINSGR